MATPGTRERPLHELLSRDMVDIYVGPSNTHWILHEKLLCHRSRFFRNIFYNSSNTTNKKKPSHSSSKNTVYGLPDEDDAAFKLFVGWLYSEHVPAPKEEKDLSELLDVYFMAEKWEIQPLITAVLDAVRRYYHDAEAWPSLRRVQYVYANTTAESPMRQLVVSCVARMLVLGEAGEKRGVPRHWESALRKNGQMAVDIILCVQKWRFEPEQVPDPREEAVESVVEEAEKKKKGMEERAAEHGGEGDDGDDEDENLLDWGEAKTVSQDVSRSQSQSGLLPNGH